MSEAVLISRIKEMKCGSKTIPQEYIDCFNDYIETVINARVDEEKRQLKEKILNRKEIKMLKIKDNVDLKELEKFGFEKQPEYAYGYYFKHFSSTGARVAICKNRDELTEREICLDSLELKLKDSISDYEETLFDLISAGLVEKVSEKNENKINYCCEECIKYFSKKKIEGVE